MGAFEDIKFSLIGNLRMLIKQIPYFPKGCFSISSHIESEVHNF
jgi:hypothetical protein